MENEDKVLEMKLRDMRLTDNADYVPSLTPEQRLVFSMLVRATRDGIETAFIDDITAREARVWILREDNSKFSASWWAELSDLETVLECCRKVIRKWKRDHAEYILSGNRPGEKWCVGSRGGRWGSKLHWTIREPEYSIETSITFSKS